MCSIFIFKIEFLLVLREYPLSVWDDAAALLLNEANTRIAASIRMETQILLTEN